jgi:hypothetical protein
MEEDDSRARPTDNSDKVSDKELQSSESFHCNSATRDTKKSVFTTKATYQWVLRGLVIQVALFHCASSVANNLQMQQWLQKN